MKTNVKKNVVLNYKNSFSEAISVVLKYENSLKNLQEQFSSVFSSREAKLRIWVDENRLANWSIYKRQETNTRYKEALWCKANWMSPDMLGLILKNQNNDLDFIEQNWNSYIDSDWKLSDKAISHFASEWIRFEIVVKNLWFSSLINEIKLEDYKIKLSKRFLSVFNWVNDKWNQNYEGNKLEKLSYEFIIELLNTNFPNEMHEIKLYLRDLELVKQDINSLTLEKLIPIQENLDTLRENLKTATWDEASELRKNIKKLNDSRHQLEKWAIAKLKNKEKAVLKAISKFKKEIIPVMFPIYCKALY